MNSLWKKEFCASKSEDTPDSIIREQCDYLRELTSDKILAKCIPYTGPTRSYSLSITSEEIMKKLQPLQMRQYNIQKDLGELEEGRFSYEFYITCIAAPNYKYRIMFIEYGFDFYPVLVTLDEDIAKDLSIDTEIECKSQDDFTQMLSEVLNSSKLETVINNLLSLAEKKEHYNSD